MNEKGMMYLLEMGIGLMLLMGLIGGLTSPIQVPSDDARIRMCHDLASVWTYDQGNIADAIEIMKLETRIQLNPASNEGKGDYYFCTATRAGLLGMETLTIRIE